MGALPGPSAKSGAQRRRAAARGPRQTRFRNEHAAAAPWAAAAASPSRAARMFGAPPRPRRRTYLQLLAAAQSERPLQVLQELGLLRRLLEQPQQPVAPGGRTSRPAVHGAGAGLRRFRLRPKLASRSPAPGDPLLPHKAPGRRRAHQRAAQALAAAAAAARCARRPLVDVHGVIPGLGMPVALRPLRRARVSAASSQDAAQDVSRASGAAGEVALPLAVSVLLRAAKMRTAHIPRGRRRMRPPTAGARGGRPQTFVIT